MKCYERIICFVRDTLGCSCPDEVFGDIQYHAVATPSEPNSYRRSIMVGNRLLIRVVHLEPSQLQEVLPQLVARGRTERDDRGLNRFRVVVVSDEPKRSAPLAQQIFATLPEVDEKVHLHVLSADAVDV